MKNNKQLAELLVANVNILRTALASATINLEHEINTNKLNGLNDKLFENAKKIVSSRKQLLTDINALLGE